MGDFFSKDERDKRFKAGQEVENSYFALFEPEDVKRANPYQDRYEHFDGIVQSKKVDVKGRKKYKGQYDDNVIYIEILNIEGKQGWLYGKADYIAFELEHKWLEIGRKTLVDFIESKVIKEVTEQCEPYKLYRRKNQKDIMTLVYTTDLVPLGKLRNKYGR